MTALLATAAVGAGSAALVFVYAGGALLISFLCSLLEASLLSARLTSLMERKERGDRGAAVLLDIKQRRIDDAITSILTLNTVAHTVGATLAGAQAAKAWGNEWVGVFSGVLTLLILVLTEIIPKTLGTVHADRLAGFTGRTILLLVKALAPALWATRFLTRMFASEGKGVVSRGELAALVALAASEGALKRDEHRVLANVLDFQTVRVEDAMTPRTVTTMLPASATLADLLADRRVTAYSRVPLYEGNHDSVTGYVLQREVLGALARGGDPATPLASFRRQVLFVPEHATLADAMRQMLAESEHVAIAVDEFGGTSGLLTLEDIIETILGIEIVDESDRVTDLRKLAAELRDRRLATREVGASEATAPTASTPPAPPAPQQRA